MNLIPSRRRFLFLSALGLAGGATGYGLVQGVRRTREAARRTADL